VGEIGSRQVVKQFIKQFIKRLIRGITDQAEPVPGRGVGEFPQNAAFPDPKFPLDEQYAAPAGFGSPE
jgi:hypothetical protein